MVVHHFFRNLRLLYVVILGGMKCACLVFFRWLCILSWESNGWSPCFRNPMAVHPLGFCVGVQLSCFKKSTLFGLSFLGLQWMLILF